MKELVVKVIENEPLVAGVYKMKFSLPEKAEGLACGRFVNISTGDGGHLLRRPIAICEYTPDTVTICYQLKGEGTQLLSRVRPGDMLSCVLPLGNGFALRKEEKRVALIGGGVGVFRWFPYSKSMRTRVKISALISGSEIRLLFVWRMCSGLFLRAAALLRMTAVTVKSLMRWRHFSMIMRRRNRM